MQALGLIRQDEKNQLVLTVLNISFVDGQCITNEDVIFLNKTRHDITLTREYCDNNVFQNFNVSIINKKTPNVCLSTLMTFLCQ